MNLYNRMGSLPSPQPPNFRKSFLPLLSEFSPGDNLVYHKRGYISSVEPMVIKLRSCGSPYFVSDCFFG